MPNQQTQDPTHQTNANGMSSDDLAATLGFISTLSRHHMTQQQEQQAASQQETPQSSVVSETASTAPSSPQPQEDLKPQIEALKGEFEGLKTEIKKDIKDEIGSIKDMIKEALQNETG